ncbi:hypothetical protein [Planctomyces sp. SH-PL62]|uniref:hypothetical protein n=1 Tax=Planctomyces sp. SH-PL62 TaxID=1636152 RepID=UPI00078D8D93|nr:hypothetical protein [Planctomyces sp. SH-PL62]AMV36722.1 hypothetical protein VT85_04780 [Planctomyces sp. SH-PL62]
MKPPVVPILRRPSVAIVVAVALLEIGCAGDRDDVLRVATNRTRAECARLAREFAEWLRDRPEREAVDAGAIAWIELPEDEPIASSARRADLLLGGPISDYARLAAEGRLESLGDGAPRPYWVVASRGTVGLSDGSGSSTRLALADPRLDPATRAWALGRRADREPWSARYASLVGLYGEAEVPIGWRAGSARATVERGRAGRTVAVPEPAEASSFEAVEFVEGAAIPIGARRSRAARAFLKFLAETRGAEPGPKFESPLDARPEADAEDLAADLLGATLVDAQPELSAASAAVRKAGSPAWATDLLTQPPPWPPASVEKLLRREGEAGLTLVETLIGQVAPAPDLRLWLAQSWLKPRRPLDGEVLAEVAAGAGGRLAREPRFRSWLKAEWTQWARQRYRWVARLAASGVAPVFPPPPPPSSDS